jgi:IS30 family transposase
LRHIHQIIKEKLGLGLPEHLQAGKIHCPVCAISKSTRINLMASTNREIGRMDIFAVDLIGPFQVDLVDGGKYIMTMRDVATGYCFVCVLTHKWEATGHIILIIDKVENFTELKVKILRSNNGGEFVNNNLKAYLEQKKIVAERVLPYHHYQKGVIERFNRTTAAMARTILLDNTLPKTFWSYTFIWAAHTLNWVPNKASGKITPLEAFLRHKPQFGNF